MILLINGHVFWFNNTLLFLSLCNAACCFIKKVRHYKNYINNMLLISLEFALFKINNLVHDNFSLCQISVFIYTEKSFSFKLPSWSILEHFRHFQWHSGALIYNKWFWVNIINKITSCLAWKWNTKQSWINSWFKQNWIIFCYPMQNSFDFFIILNLRLFYYLSLCIAIIYT